METNLSGGYVKQFVLILTLGGGESLTERYGI